MNELFTPNSTRHSTRRPLDLFIPRVNQTTFARNSFWYWGSKLWKSLLDSVKTATNLNTFKELVKSWNGPECKYNFCNFVE